MHTNNHNAVRIVALLLLTSLLCCAFASCKDKNKNDREANPVVMRTEDVEITLYDFRQSFYGSQYYQYYYYGMMTAEAYCNAIIDEVSAFMYVYNAAIDAGIELTAEEEATFDEEFNTQLDSVISQYESNVDESITDAAEKRAEAIKLLEADLSADGFTYEDFVTYSRNNLHMYKVADKYYNTLRDAVVTPDDDVQAYVDAQVEASSELTITTFNETLGTYNDGDGPAPVYVPDDCFSVNHILLLFKTETDESGDTVYLTDSRVSDELEVEALLPTVSGIDGFMGIETTYGDDPGMDSDVYVENGYLVHADLEDTYYKGFVYAAMNLYYGEWFPELPADSDEPYIAPELEYFTLADGTRIVKVATEMGIHYIIVNKIYTRGVVDYEIGDAAWESWRDYVGDEAFNTQYSALYEQWKTTYTIEVFKEKFWSEFVPETAESTAG